MTDNNEMNDAEAALEHLRQKHGKNKTTPTEEPSKDPEATDNEPDTDPEDATEKPEDSPEPGRKKTRNGPLKRLVDNHPRVTTGIILGVTAFTIAIAATSVAYATQTVDGKLDDVTGHIVNLRHHGLIRLVALFLLAAHNVKQRELLPHDG